MPTQMPVTCRLTRVLEGKLRRLARTQRRLERLDAELTARLDALTALYTGRIGALRSAVERMRSDIERLCRTRRDALMGGRRSLVTAYGTVGFRRAGPSVHIEPRMLEAACEELCRRGLAHLVRVRREADKPAIKRALAEGGVTAELLSEWGIRVNEGEERFYCYVNDGAAGTR